MSFSYEVAARTLWQEARGEPLDGQKAVASVIWNRLKDGRWGRTLASVCLWKGQFSGWYMPHDPNFAGACSLAEDDKTLCRMRDIIAGAHSEADMTGGATHYYAVSIDPPAWVQGAIFCGQFGHHKFYRGVK